jgi:hypothetical protein
MKLEHAKTRILDLWRTEKKTWKEGDYISFFQSARSFYDKLNGKNADLLSFNWLGDKWQVVSRWIHEYEGYLHY